MSGDIRYLLDTNAIVALLQGNSKISSLLDGANWIGVSIISQIEFLAFTGLTEADRLLFQELICRVEIVGLSADDYLLINDVVKIRQQYRLKLPDAAIAAMAVRNSATLVTADQEFLEVTPLTVATW